MQLPEDQMHTVGTILHPPVYRKDVYYTLLFARTQSGLGDWIMLLDVIKMVNQQYPNIHVYVDTQNMPWTFESFIQRWDVDCELVDDPDPYGYAYYSGHMVYPAPEVNGGHFIAGMVGTLNMRTGLNLRLTQLAKYNAEERIDKGKYMLVALDSLNTDKRCETMLNEFVVRSVVKHIPVMQFTQPIDLTEVGDRIANALGVITLETGVSHMAGHIGVPCLTYYSTGSTYFGNVGYPLQEPVGAAALRNTCEEWTIGLIEAARWKEKLNG